jgi:hypothetical protein
MREDIGTDFYFDTPQDLPSWQHYYTMMTPGTFLDFDDVFSSLSFKPMHSF